MIKKHTVSVVSQPNIPASCTDVVCPHHYAGISLVPLRTRNVESDTGKDRADDVDRVNTLDTPRKVDGKRGPYKA